MTKTKAYLNWSSGKDAMLALHKIKMDGKYAVKKLFTTVNLANHRISMHGVRQNLLEQQAKSLGFPLDTLKLPENTSMESYNAAMEKRLKNFKKEKLSTSIFGDIFLEDLKNYRENQLQKMKMKAVFPLWKKDTAKLIVEFMDLGYKAIVVCVNAKVLDKSFCGRLIDENFLADLPKNVDPCGENGEFHTFVFDGPLFKNPVEFKIGETVERDYSPSKNGDDDCFTDDQKWDTKFWFTDLKDPNSL